MDIKKQPSAAIWPRPGENVKKREYNHNVIPFPAQAGLKLPPYARRVLAIRRDGRILTVLTGSGAMDEAARRYELESKYCDPPSAFVVVPYERNASGYDWGFTAGLDVAICTAGQPETDISLLHLAGLVLKAGSGHVVVRLAARVEILRRDYRGAIWRLN